MDQSTQQTLFDGAIVISRVVTILPLLLGVTIMMGRRAVGELPVFDFLIILTLGSIAGADIADPRVPHIHTVIAMLGVSVLQIVAARLSIRYRSVGRLISFEPIIVIRDGKLLKENMRKCRYSIDNVLQMMREADVFDMKEVDIGIIEANGKLTILKKTSNHEIAFPVVVDGHVHPDVLRAVKLDEKWLDQQLKRQGITDMDSVFFASVTEKQELHVSLKQESNTEIPPLHH